MKLKFPTDRVIFFSDAVFAIAMTLLILEIKVPTQEELSELGLAGVLAKRIPHFIGYIISFFVTAAFWRAHVQLCTLVKTATDRFFTLNIWLLFCVVLMPFSTAFYAGHFSDNDIFAFYCVNIAMIAFFSYLLTRHVHQNENLSELFSDSALRWHRSRALIVMFVFLLSIPLAYLSPAVGRLAFLMIFGIHAWGDRYIERREKRLTENKKKI